MSHEYTLGGRSGKEVGAYQMCVKKVYMDAGNAGAVSSQVLDDA